MVLRVTVSLLGGLRVLPDMPLRAICECEVDSASTNSDQGDGRSAGDQEGTEQVSKCFHAHGFRLWCLAEQIHQAIVEAVGC